MSVGEAYRKTLEDLQTADFERHHVYRLFRSSWFTLSAISPLKHISDMVDKKVNAC